MVKKKFIDKKTSTTYSLVYRSTEEGGEDQGEEVVGDRVLFDGKSEARKGGETSVSHGREVGSHPLSWLMDEQDDIKEGRRQELIQLGFDDDGYDYTKHLRTLGSGKASLERVEEQEEEGPRGEERIVVGKDKRKKKDEEDRVLDGPSVFVKAPVHEAPEEDVALFDASQLTVMEQVDEEDEATGMMGGVTAFARKQSDPPRKKNSELSEVEKMLEEMEIEDEDGDGRILGEGDLLDDFIVNATCIKIEEEKEEDGDDDVGSGSGKDSASHGVIWGDDDHVDVPHRPPGSIASTYWREERHDRKNLLGVIDEQFEQLALEYDEDELGDMDDLAEDIHGIADVHEFENILDEFIRENPKKDSTDANKRTLFLAEEMDAYGFGNDDADTSIRMARRAIRLAEEEENSGSNTKIQNTSNIDLVFEKPREEWDCESILSLKSNMYNHPGTISEPAKSHNAGAKTIELNKSGLPVEYVPKRDFVSVKPMDEIHNVRALAPTIRKKGETLDEKKARKMAVKAAKREARATKKELKILFKQEKGNAAKRDANAPVQPAVLM